MFTKRRHLTAGCQGNKWLQHILWNKTNIARATEIWEEVGESSELEHSSRPTSSGDAKRRYG